MTQASRIIWFNENDVSFVNVASGHEYKSGETVTADSSDYNTTFKITLKDSNKHWPAGERLFKFQQTDPENPVDPMYINGLQTTLYNDHFTFASNALYTIFEYGGTGISSSLDKENSFHFNALLDSSDNIIQDKDIITNNPNVIASSKFSLGFGDHVKITAKPGYKITNVKMYTRLSDGAKFADYTNSLDSNGNLAITFKRDPIPKVINAGLYADSANVWGYYAKVTTEPITSTEPAPTIPTKIDFNVKYNNGLTTVNDLFPGQKAGIISGTVNAGKGYSITGVTSAYYRNPNTALHVNLRNFTATKISDYQYSYSFTLTDTDIKTLNNTDKTVHLRVNTKKELGNINIDSTNLKHCSVSPATVTQGKETVLTLNADSGYILNGSGSYSVDGTTSRFTCTNVTSYQITATANRSISISFVATKTETKPSSIIHTYILSQDNYNNLGKQIIESTNSSGTGFEQYDYTKFVNYLYEIPFEIGTDITTSTSTINLGKQNLPIECRKVTHETLNINLGTIDLTGVSSSHDYNPFNITLFCPFSSNIDLPATVIGSKLYLSFSINLKTEQGLLLVKQNDNIIYSGQTELFTDLPLYYTAGLQDTIIRQLRAQYQNTIKQAYIVVNYHKPITNLTSYTTCEHGTLSNYKGYTRVSHGTLKRSISSSIDNALLSLLRQGVIIK